ncbi:hypothetical protein AB0P17_29620 [Streptomyces sp. NPDC088124]|uniref:hypothetical protein n=1 Tax=Streptomyces sp. NPDC088124 TaxID=3154654 RepID=UPI0034323ACC
MSTIGSEGWTLVHQARQKHYDDRYYGHWLGTRDDGQWIIGRLYPGKSMDDGFRDGEWAYSKRFAGDPSTDNADAALTAYVEMAHNTFVWDRVFDQTVGEAIDLYWAGPEVPDAPKLAAGWAGAESPNPDRVVSSAGCSIAMPLHEAKFLLLHYLRRTELAAKAHLTKGVTVDRHGAVEKVRCATGPIRFEYGYNTYWLT